MKIIYFDVETRGEDDKKNGILQLAGEVELDGTAASTFNYKMKVFPGQVIEDGALDANGFTRSQVEGFDDPFKCFIQFMSMLNRYVDRFDRSDKFTLVGYNSRFDDGFLREWFKNNNEKYYGAYFH
ncbi:MAG: 3'-5' exonuclease, partial [Candidatus Brocadiaceae bacterium]|nr:3'-5' exonuclease [Candidatus Brocadiaceae bacterium]